MTEQNKHQKVATRRCARNGGYTLIEMAIAITIVGLLIAPAAAVYSNWLQHQKQQTTLTNVSDLLSALQSYRAKNGSFPCPSGLNVARTNANYGAPVNCSYAAMGAAAVGACQASGVCIEQSARTVFPIPPKAPATLAYQQRVIVGAIPFRVLQIPEKKAYDGYGSRLVYVLTLSMGDPDYVNSANGAITIKDPTLARQLVNPADSAVFAVFSPGPDRVGGWNADGVEFSRCVGAVGADVTNCNKGFEGGVASVNALLVDGYATTAPGAAHFDDYMAYFQSQADPLWRIIPNTQNIQDLTDKSVGIGLTPASGILDVTDAASVASPNQKLSDGVTNNTDALLVYGTSAAGNAGAIQADRICDATGANCFDPTVIGGDNTVAGKGMKCTVARTYMSGIDGATGTGQNGADCSVIEVRCSGTTPLMNGFNADGTPNCIGFGCTGAITTSCGNSVTPTGGPFVNGQIVSLTNLNSATNGCVSEQWTCTNGTWTGPTNRTNFSPTNYCSFSSTCSDPGCDCTVLHGPTYVNNPPTSYCTKQFCTTCGGGGITTVTADNCGCKSPDVTNPACPAPFTGGTYTQTITYAGAGCTGTTTNDFSTCQCNLPTPVVTNVACPAGFNNGNAAVQTCNLDTTTCTYNCTTDNSACQCITQADIVDTQNCVAPATGTYTTTQTFINAPGVQCGYGPPSTVYNCMCPADAPGGPAACPGPWTGGTYTWTDHYTLNNPTCDVSQQNPDFSGCQCNLPTLNNSAPCGPGYNFGGIAQTMDRDLTQPNTCVYGGWVNVPGGNTCACNAQPPTTQPCGSCASLPGGSWTGTQICDVAFNSTAGPPSPPNCAYGNPTNPHGCVCDTTTQFPCSPGTQDCSLGAGYGLDCYTQVNPTGHYTNSNSPPTQCTAGSCQTDTAGRCDPIPFKWKLGSGTGNFFNPKVGLPTEGEACSCQDHRDTINGATQFCFKNDVNNFERFFCTCQ